MHSYTCLTLTVTGRLSKSTPSTGVAPPVARALPLGVTVTCSIHACIVHVGHHYLHTSMSHHDISMQHSKLLPLVYLAWQTALSEEWIVHGMVTCLVWDDAYGDNGGVLV